MLLVFLTPGSPDGCCGSGTSAAAQGRKGVVTSTLPWGTFDLKSFVVVVFGLRRRELPILVHNKHEVNFLEIMLCGNQNKVVRFVFRLQSISKYYGHQIHRNNSTTLSHKLTYLFLFCFSLSNSGWRKFLQAFPVQLVLKVFLLQVQQVIFAVLNTFVTPHDLKKVTNVFKILSKYG